MTTCPEYKALIDRCSDVEAGEAAGLTAHLATCPGCTEYKADADKTMKLLREFRRRLTTADPLDQALERLSSRLTASRRQMVWAIVLVAACITAPFVMALRGELPLVVAGLLVVMCAGSAAILWVGARDQRALAQLAHPGDGLYASWKSDLERRIKMTTGGAVVVSVWSIGFLFAGTFVFSRPEEQFAVLSTAFLLAAGALHTFFVELRDLKNELAFVREATSG